MKPGIIVNQNVSKRVCWWEEAKNLEVQKQFEDNAI